MREGDPIAWLSEHFLYVMLAAATVFTATWLVLMRRRLEVHPAVAVLLAVLAVVYGMLCVKGFAIFEGDGVGAMSLFGVVFLMPVALFAGAKLFKRPMGEVFDVFTVPMVFTVMLARCNCLHAGCCLGRYMFHTQMRWPTREAEIVFYLVFLALIIPRVWKGTTKGRVYPLYMAAYGAFRAIVECFRESSSETLFHLSHVWAFLALALGLSIYIELHNRTKKKSRKRM